MDNMLESSSPDLAEHHIVHADEVDQTGADIANLSEEQLLHDFQEELQAAKQRKSRRNDDDSTYGVPQRQPPELRRDSASAPPPPLPPMKPPPPAPVVQQPSESPTDSLSLLELRRFVHERQGLDQPAYDFEYADSQPFPEEVNEWFQYSEQDWLMLLETKEAFENGWETYISSQNASSSSWTSAQDNHRAAFIKQTLTNLEKSRDLLSRVEALGTLCYIVTGVWGVTAGLASPNYPSESELTAREIAECPKSKSLQIEWMEKNVKLFHSEGGIQILYRCLHSIIINEKEVYEASYGMLQTEEGAAAYAVARDRELTLSLTVLYMVIEVARKISSSGTEETLIRDTLIALEPNPLIFLIETIANLRWEEASYLPLQKLILLLWKSILLFWGGSDTLARLKTALEPDHEIDEEAECRYPVLLTSPLDYHHFRQEITSKYPAYNPPPPLVPFELETNSILPPIQPLASDAASSPLFNDIVTPASRANGSILHQSVHIATPAPSPPPSPMGSNGKVAKKQNYQTSPHFPFMYPPFEGRTNIIGGGRLEADERRTNMRDWQDTDVPASIIEAGQILSSRMRMTRATKQLWDERERFMKYERGWHLDDVKAGKNVVEFDEEEKDILSSPSTREDNATQEKRTKDEKPRRRVESNNPDVQRYLNAVESFYRKAMPHLQSLVIVLLKEVLANITEAAIHSGPGNGRGNQNDDAGVEDLNTARAREITTKAISGVLFLLTKWFKRSHVLKFEYFTQLLLDSNYLPLILKMFLHQDVDQLVAQDIDKEGLSFFHFCHANSAQPPEAAKLPSHPSRVTLDDDAAPPPIFRRTNTQARVSDLTRGRQAGEAFNTSTPRPEVDELGRPLTEALPGHALVATTCSFRNFFSAINFLRVMQKITKKKAHRCLLLVQYKSSAILRKGMKVPDPHLRLYTLKLFKSQVPYSSRKWRQSHMKIITAIYLYCRPELRDDWLTGGDVDAEVDRSLPMEQAIRGLTHWWHMREYRSVLAIQPNHALTDERDFFVRELEKMGWGIAGDELLADQDMRDI
ncbi:Factor arrest protein 11 [Ascosphaera aggregata]|nr:Factor arrest protein 11 [Ascosphaera aggregata]